MSETYKGRANESHQITSHLLKKQREEHFRTNSPFENKVSENRVLRRLESDSDSDSDSESDSDSDSSYLRRTLFSKTLF